jgi:hypothetical protein
VMVFHAQSLPPSLPSPSRSLFKGSKKEGTSAERGLVVEVGEARCTGTARGLRHGVR